MIRWFARLCPPLLAALAAVTPAISASTPYPKFLSEAGLRLGPAGKLLPFGTAQAGAQRSLFEAFGKPVRQRTIPDCGQGQPMREAAYRGGLTITYLKGRFSGWSIEKPATLRTDRDIAIGSTRATVGKAYPGLDVDDGSLGIMFVTDEGLGGFLDSVRPTARVTALYAGETCMVS